MAAPTHASLRFLGVSGHQTSPRQNAKLLDLKDDLNEISQESLEKIGNGSLEIYQKWLDPVTYSVMLDPVGLLVRNADNSIETIMLDRSTAKTLLSLPTEQCLCPTTRRPIISAVGMVGLPAQLIEQMHLELKKIVAEGVQRNVIGDRW